MPLSAERRFLALDLGTTAVKGAVVDLKRGDSKPELVAKYTAETRAYVGGYALEKEQDVSSIIAAINEAIGWLSNPLDGGCSGLAASDQMHGVVLWDSKNPSRRSRLITWEDGRADPALQAAFNALLSERTSSHCHSPVFAGYGFVTLAALLLARHPWVSGDEAFDCAGTVGAYIQNILAGNFGQNYEAVQMDPTDAASWGGYDVKAGRFDTDVIGAISPVLLNYLPRVVPSGTAIGRLSQAGAEALGLTTLSPLYAPGLEPVVNSQRASLRLPVADEATPPFLQLSDNAPAVPSSPSLHDQPVLAQPAERQRPLVYVCIGDHAAATAAALAYAVRLQQVQVATQLSFRSRLRAGSLGSLASSETTGAGGGAHSASSVRGGASSHHSGSVASSDDDSETVLADEFGIPGMGRLTTIVINVGTAAQVAAAGEAVVSLLESGSDGQGRGLPLLPVGCELRPLPRIRLDGPSNASTHIAASAHGLHTHGPSSLGPASSPTTPIAPAAPSDASAAVVGPADVSFRSDISPAPSPTAALDVSTSSDVGFQVASGAQAGGALFTSFGGLALSPTRQSSYGSVATTASGTAASSAGPAGIPTPLMLVAASMNGGNVLACIAERLTRWGAALSDMQARARAAGPANASPMVGPRAAEWSTKATYFFLESEAAKVFLDPSRYAPQGDAAAAPPPPGAGGSPGSVAGVTFYPSLARERVPVGFRPRGAPQLPSASSSIGVGAGAQPAIDADSTLALSPSSAAPASTGIAIAGLTADNSDSPGAMYAAAAQAVVRNVCGLLPASVWHSADIVVATGGALFKSAVLRRCLNEYVAQVEAAAGRARGELQVVVLDEGRAEFAGCIGAVLTAASAPMPSGASIAQQLQFASAAPRTAR